MSAPGQPGRHVLALVKQVPQHEESGELGPSGRLVRDGVPAELNPFCRRAVAHAVRIARDTGGTSTAVTMGPPRAADVLREAAACGVDRTVLVSDPAFAGSDCLATARVLAAAIANLPPPDLIVAGRSSVDADTGAIGPMVAEALGLPFVGPALSLEVCGDVVRATLQHDDAEERVEVRGPAVVAVAERSIPPAKAAPGSWPDDRARRITARELPGGAWGMAGSGTVVCAVRAAAPGRRAGVRLAGAVTEQAARAVDLLLARDAFADPAPAPIDRVASPGDPAGPVVLALLDGGDAARRALLGEAARLAALIAGHVVAVGPGDAAQLATWGADRALVPTHREPRPLAASLAASPPWAVLGPATAWAREVAARLAVRLGAGLIADAIALDVVDGALVGVKPSGGGTVADIACRTPVQVATVRSGCLAVRAPRPASTIPVRRLDVAPDPEIARLESHPVDEHGALDRARHVIGVGRGVDPARYHHLEPLRELLGAQLAATRPVTDAGWLPHGRQVGITARTIAPRLYVAVGIGGSGNHLAGVLRAGTVLAINADPDAAIFDAADVGVVADWQPAVAALVAELDRRL